MLAISTPDDSGNFYSRMLMAKQPNVFPERPLIPSKMIDLACALCRARGVTAECEHKAHLRPPWRSQEGQDLQKAMLSANDYAAEAQGLIVNKRIYVFDGKLVDAIFVKSAPRALIETQGTVFVAIDPSWGSANLGRMAIVSFVFAVDRVVVSSPALYR